MPFSVIADYLQIITALLIAVIVHEYSHGWVAEKLGDPTARLSGRLTLNPLKHIDPLGTILVPLALRLLGFMPIGWAKPVPVNFSRLYHPKKDMIWVALAGPTANFTLAVALSLMLKFPFVPAGLQNFAIQLILLNLMLGMFNLLPIPPLDGSRVVLGILPQGLAWRYSQLEPLGMLIVLVLLNFGALNFIWRAVILLAFLLGVGR
jgi:Zn-dependent protease